MTKEEKKIKRVRRRALLHIKVVNARDRKIPGKVAWIAALFAAVCAGAYSHSYGGLPVGAAIVMFLICSIIFQILSHAVFGLIGLITARAYNSGQDGYDGRHHAEWDNIWDDDDEWDSYRHQGTTYDYTGYGNTGDTYDNGTYDREGYDSSSHYDGSWGQSDSSQYQREDSSYDRRYENAEPDAGMGVEQALKIFGVNLGTFSSSDLKEKWREMIKKNHPDQNVDADNSDKYEEKTKQINIAYEILKGYACDA